MNEEIEYKDILSTYAIANALNTVHQYLIEIQSVLVSPDFAPLSVENSLDLSNAIVEFIDKVSVIRASEAGRLLDLLKDEFDNLDIDDL